MSRQTHLQAAINKLNIDDSLALKRAFSGDDTVAQCHKMRTSPVNYLSKTFQHAVTLLSVMFDTGCVISGSRALDFFVPGSTTAESDWDFYVPGYKESVADMVNILSLCGVIWDEDAGSIAGALVRSGRVEVKRTVLEALLSWVALDGDENLFSETVGDILRTYIGLKDHLQLVETYAISRTPSGNLIFQPLVDEGCYADQTTEYGGREGEHFSMMRGSIQTPQGVESVQLIIGCHFRGIRSCLSFIKGFYASHVQCFIGGWCAVHMYYYHASSKEATVWEHQLDRKAADKAIQKYRDRGFLFHEAIPAEPIIRRFYDQSSMFLDYGDIYRPFLRKSHFTMLDQWLAERRQNARTIYWVEDGSKIDTISSPFERCSRRQDSFSDAGYRLPLCRLRRLSDIITLNTTTPARMRSNEFFSSVRKTVAGTRWNIKVVARSGHVHNNLKDANPWSWAM